MLSVLTLNDASGNPVTLLDTTATSKRGLRSVTGLVGVGSLRDSKRPRPTGHGGISEARWEDGKTIVLEGEIVSQASVGDAIAEFRLVTAPMLATLDTGPALLKWQEGIPGVAAIPATSSYSPAVLTDGPSLYWRLGESAGTTAADASGNSRTGTYGSTVTLGQVGALSSDTDTAVLIGNNANGVITSSYNPFVNGASQTFECWAKRATVTTRDCIFSSTGANPTNLIIQSTGGDVNFDSNQSAGTTAVWSAALPLTATWYHVVLTFNETTDVAELFVNGTSLGTRSMPDAYATTGNLQVGLFPGFPNLGSLQLDEFAVYSAVLSSARIAAHYAAASATTGGSPAVIGGLALQRLVKLDGDVSPVLQEAAAILNYQAAFFAEDPRAYSQTLSTVNSTALSTSAAGVILSAAFPWLFGASSGGVAVCTNAGNRPTPPIFRILGGCTNPVITRLSNQAKLSITGTIGTGDYLELDVAKRTVKLNGSSNATNLLDSANSDWASMEVPAGTETFTMRAASSDSTASLTVFLRSAYA